MYYGLYFTVFFYNKTQNIRNFYLSQFGNTALIFLFFKALMSKAREAVSFFQLFYHDILDLCFLFPVSARPTKAKYMGTKGTYLLTGNRIWRCHKWVKLRTTECPWFVSIDFSLLNVPKGSNPNEWLYADRVVLQGSHGVPRPPPPPQKKNHDI